MSPIEKRCQQRHTVAFVTTDTVDALGAKMIGIIGDRRITKMHRYLGEHGGTPRLFTGLRVWPGGYSGPTTVRPGLSASISLASASRMFEGIGFSTHSDLAEEDIRERYHHPETQWLGQRRDITLVELNGWPGQPARDDSIRVEYWNENGVGQETVLVFDDVDHVQEIAWHVKGDTERRVYMDDEYCTVHGRHVEDPEHGYQRGVCTLRTPTLAENLALLTTLAVRRENGEVSA